MNTFDTDYLIIGAGAAGLAFADTLLSESDAHVTLVDSHAKPGGHWNDAYPFVTLHQPSAFYGVNSTPLGSGHKDSIGLNQGLFELASGAELLAYYDRLMQQTLLPSGRVSYHPLSRWLGGGRFESLLSGEQTQVNVRRKLVDAHSFGPRVPATHQRKFAVAPGVEVLPPGALPQRVQADPPGRFVVLGAGKTAMDTITWLLRSGAPADAIQWVVPRDSWLINRVTTQPAMEFFEQAIGGQADQMAACAEATSVDDLFLRLESCGAVLRIHRDVTPRMFHLATVTPAEVALLGQVRNLVRLGRVQALEPGRMVLAQGTVEVPPQAVFVDCTASAVEPRPLQPIFQGDRIVLQMVRLPQPCFSAALTAHVELQPGDDGQKNRVCTTVPFPYDLHEYPKAMLVSLWNQAQWGQDKALRTWIRDSRLDGFGKLLAAVDPQNAARMGILARLRQQMPAAMQNLQRLAAVN